MKAQDFINIGVRPDCVSTGIESVRNASKSGRFHGATPKKIIKDIFDNPSSFVDDSDFGTFAKSLLVEVPEENIKDPVGYTVWGESDPEVMKQMDVSCRMPNAIAGAVMPDSHLGYGLPVGGVLAVENAVVPYAVGPDIACRMRCSILDIEVGKLHKELKGSMRRGDRFSESLENGTCFGVGGNHRIRKNHFVMDMNWNVSGITKAMKDRAWNQLASSGSGNHFVEYGILTINEKSDINGVSVDPGDYVALLSHSGSRGTGSAVCSEYSGRATAKLSKKFREFFGKLGWLSLDTEDGQEYWNAMNLMIEYARANHEVIHDTVCNLLGTKVIAVVQNEHNFAAKEIYNGKEVIVHRKGATPTGIDPVTGKNILGIIPGTLADSCFLVRGKGNLESLNSASHGAGRRMSRTQARKSFNWHQWKSVLKEKGIRLLSAGLDEMPGAYKDIHTVMSMQKDLVDVLGSFQPKIVKMSADGRSED